MQWEIGDKVSFLNDVGEGLIKDIDSQKGILVENEHGFEDWYHHTELVLKRSFGVSKAIFKDDIAPVKAEKSVPKLRTAPEIDLHFHELVEFPKNYTAHQALQIQLKAALGFIEKSRLAKHKRIVLIHGLGEGRLREEIHMLLERMDKLVFFDANYQRYGQGATEVEFL